MAPSNTPSMLLNLRLIWKSAGGRVRWELEGEVAGADREVAGTGWEVAGGYPDSTNLLDAALGRRGHALQRQLDFVAVVVAEHHGVGRLLLPAHSVVPLRPARLVEDCNH